MAFPENLTTRTVVGTFLTPRGLPATGYIIFSPQVALHNEDTDELVLPSPVKKNLDSTGSFSVELLDTENLDLAPSGWGYKVSYHISGVTKNEFVTVIPAGEGSIQFSDLIEIDPLELSLTVIQEILDRLDEVETGKSNIDHTHTHEDVTDLGTAALTDTGTGATNTILGNDPRLTDARTPTSHATSHQSGGSDVLAIAQSQVSDLVTDLSNKADLVDGIIPTSQIPSLAINDTFVVADEAAMLALDAQRGDVAIRSDLNRNFVLQTDGASTLAHWVLLSGGSDVLSVNGQTGIIALGPTDVGADPSGTASSLVDDLSGVTNVSAARNALGLGTAALADTGTGASNVILGNDSRLTDTRTPSAASIVDAMIASTLSPSKITGTAAILGANTFTGAQTLSNVNVVLGTTTGTKIGTSTSQKLAFYNSTPIVQPSGNALNALEALGLISSATLAVADITGLGTMATATATDYLTKAGNLSGIADAAVARTNLGLGSMATQSASAYAALTGATFTGDVTFGTTSGIRLGYGGRFYDPDATRTVLLANGNKFDVLDETGASYLFQAGGNGVGLIATNGLTANANAASVVPLVAKGYASHNADFFTVQNSAGTKLGGWDEYGQLNTQYLTDITGTSPYLRLQTNSLIAINQGNAANVAFAVRGMAAQSGNLTEWLNSSSSVLASISAAGHGTFSAGLRIPGNQSIYFGAIGSSEERLFATETQWGYSAGYRAIMLGSSSTASSGTLAGTTVFFGYNPSINASGSFNGNGGEVVFRNGMYFMVPNATDDGWMKVQQLNVDNVNTRVQHFIDGTADQIQSRVQGHSSQTANLQTWENSSATVLASISAAGIGTFAHLRCGNFIATSYVQASEFAAHPGNGGLYNWNGVALAAFKPTQTGPVAYTATAANVALTVNNAHATPTGKLTSWQANSAEVASVSAAGLGTFAGLSSGASVTITATNGSFISQGASGQWSGLDLKTGTSNRWKIQRNGTAETGTNAGSDLDFLAYQDDGATYATPLTITRASGAAKFTSHLATGVPITVKGAASQSADLQTWINSSSTVLASVSAAGLGTFAGLTSTANITTAAGYVMIDRSGDATHASIYFQRDGGESNQIIGRTGSSNRWMLRIGNTTAETGTNAGSDLDFLAYQDDGATYATPLTITRASGAAKFTSHLATGVPITVKGATSQSANLTQWQDSSAAVLASVSAAGLGTFAGVTSTENVAVTKSQSATTRIAVTNGSTNANALAEIRAATDAGYTGLFKHPAAYGGYKILGASDAAIYNATAGHISILNDVASGVIRFAAGGASSTQVQIETTGKLTTFTPTAAAASVRLPHGTAPTTPADGDMWTTAAGLYVHINGSTVGPLS